MRVCFWGTFDQTYTRHQILVKGLEENGVEIVVCHEAVWQKSRDKTKAYKGIFGKVRLGIQLIWAYLKLLVRYFQMPKHDVLFVSFLGHFDMLLARILATLFSRRLVFDVFISLYDTTIYDRNLKSPKSIWARFLRSLDRVSCSLADLVILDTEEHIDYFVGRFRIPRKRFYALPVGANDEIYKPENKTAVHDNESVLLYCRYAPLHGVETVLKAALELKIRRGLRFRLIGNGQTRSEMEKLARSQSLENIDFIDSVDECDLAKEIERATLCLGIFGATGKAQRVIPNKLYQCAAMGKAMITGRSPALERVFLSMETIYYCEMANGLSLAHGIIELLDNQELREKLARNSRQFYLENFRPVFLGKQLKERLDREFSRGGGL